MATVKACFGGVSGDAVKGRTSTGNALRKTGRGEPVSPVPRQVQERFNYTSEAQARRAASFWLLGKENAGQPRGRGGRSTDCPRRRVGTKGRAWGFDNHPPRLARTGPCESGDVCRPAREGYRPTRER